MTGYNQVIKDFAQAVSDVMADTIFTASRLHLLDTNKKLYDEIESNLVSTLFDIDEIMASNDPRVQRIMKTYFKAAATLDDLKAYWKTTEEWSNGEEL